MHLATVVGTLWSTKKDDSLTGLRFLVVQPHNADGTLAKNTMIAADNVGAGIGERVLVVHGRAARYLIGRGHDVGFQADSGQFVCAGCGAPPAPCSTRAWGGRAPSRYWTTPRCGA